MKITFIEHSGFMVEMEKNIDVKKNEEIKEELKEENKED